MVIPASIVETFTPEIDGLVAAAVPLMLAALLGAVLGWEREQKGRAAGLKTHILVAMGSALFVLSPELDGIDGANNTRVMQGIVSGIGLVGAGAILRSRSGARVEGLTTAASIWITAAIGMAAGMGLAWPAILATLLAWLVVAVVPKLVGNTPSHDGQN